MDSSVDDEAKSRAVTRVAERITKESETLPFRWGYFQGVVLIPWSLLVISSVVSDLVAPHPYPWYQLTIALLMGLLGLPLAYSLLRKRAFAFPLVHAMFGLSLLLAAIRLPHVMRHYADPGEKSSGLFHAALLLTWLLSMMYYQRRKAQFH
jgi:predicted membrane channel-forming protein YqfA (hemolysin III family)